MTGNILPNEKREHFKLKCLNPAPFQKQMKRKNIAFYIKGDIKMNTMKNFVKNVWDAMYEAFALITPREDI